MKAIVLHSILAIGSADGCAATVGYTATDEKTLVLKVLVLILLFALLKKDKPVKRPFVDVIVLHDAVEATALPPNPDAIFKLYSFARNINKKALFSYAPISGTQVFAYEEEYLCDGASSIKEDASHDVFYRCEQMRLFKDAISKAIADNHAAVPVVLTEHAECYRTIATYLNVFDSATSKILLVHSALLERSDLFDCTDATDRMLLTENPATLAARFKEACPIKNVKDVTVIFIHKALTKEAETYYLEMVEVYRELLTPLGAEINVQSTTDTYTL